ncbi:hypothetical protein D3C71_1967080 [compost metagenome]
MAHHPRVLQKGLVAGEDVQVGAADPHALDAQQHFAFAADGAFTLLGAQGAGGFTDYGQHGGSRGLGGCAGEPAERRRRAQEPWYFL